MEQIAAAVGLADALVRYGSADLDATSFERSNGHVALVTPVVDAWPLEAPTRRAERAFGLSLEVGADGTVALRRPDRLTRLRGATCGRAARAADHRRRHRRLGQEHAARPAAQVARQPGLPGHLQRVELVADRQGHHAAGQAIAAPVADVVQL